MTQYGYWANSVPDDIKSPNGRFRADALRTRFTLIELLIVIAVIEGKSSTGRGSGGHASLPPVDARVRELFHPSGPVFFGQLVGEVLGFLVSREAPLDRLHQGLQLGQLLEVPAARRPGRLPLRLLVLLEFVQPGLAL